MKNVDVYYCVICKAPMSGINQPLSKDHHVVWIGKTRKQILLSLSGHNLHKKKLKTMISCTISVLRFTHGSIWPATIPPPGNPRDKSSFSRLGLGNCLKRSCPGGRGWGKSKITTLWFCEARVISCAVSMTQEFVAAWLRNDLSKLQFQTNAGLMRWLDCFFFVFFAKETKKYFFSHM